MCVIRFKTFQDSITSSLNLDHNICCSCQPFYYIRLDPAERSVVKPHLCSSLWKSLTFSFWFLERYLSSRSKLCGTCRLGNRWALNKLSRMYENSQTAVVLSHYSKSICSICFNIFDKTLRIKYRSQILFSRNLLGWKNDFRFQFSTGEPRLDFPLAFSGSIYRVLINKSDKLQELNVLK